MKKLFTFVGRGFKEGIFMFGSSWIFTFDILPVRKRDIPEAPQHPQGVEMW